MKAKTLSVLAAVMALAIFSYAAFAADPMGPGQANPGTPERRGGTGTDNTTGGKLVQAQAGNVTALNINSTRITSRC